MVELTNNKNSKTKQGTERQRPAYKEASFDPSQNKKGLTSLTEYKTHDGHRLTVKEAKFIDLYIETGNGRQSVIEAGYKSKAPGQYAQELLYKQHIRSEIDFRLKQLEDEKIASAEEILQYFTGVMRGEIKDQFGLDTPLSERTKAAQELAKRKIDIANKVAGKEESNGTVTIKLDWSGMVERENGTGEEEEVGENENEQ